MAINRRQAMRALAAVAGVGAFAHMSSVGAFAEFGSMQVTFEDRTRLMDKLMEHERLDALAFATPDLFRFATSFRPDDRTPFLCVVPRSSAPFVVLSEGSARGWRDAHESGGCVTNAFWLAHRHANNPLPLMRRWRDHVADTLNQAGLYRARVGTDDVALLSPPAALLPQLALRDIGALMREIQQR